MNSISSTVFEERYNRLNKAQKQAVDTLEGPILVVAGPGTGKTTILTLRIANILLKTDTPPSGILAITYTDAGVKAMKEKLREVIGSRADEVRIHTFHGFAAAVIAEHKEHFVHLDGVRQMTDIDADSLVRSILQSESYAILCPLGKPDLYIRPILEGIRDAKKEAFSPDMVRSHAKAEILRVSNDPASLSSRGATKGQLKAEIKKQIEKYEKTMCFAEVYAEYEQKKKEMELMDFDDLIFEVLLAMGKDELLLRLLQEKFLYILVDEHQDTNDSQNLIIKMLADFFESPNVFIVGDEKQAIYRFQGASVANFLSFEKRWPEMTIISLENNYRSHQAILDASFHMIENNYVEGEHEKLRIKLKGGDMQTRPIDVIEAGDVNAGEQYLAKELKRIAKEEPKKTVAIISKTNRDVERVIRLCQNEQIAVSAERSIDIFSHPVGLILFALIQYIYDSLDTEALGKTLTAGLWNLSFTNAITLLKQLRGNDISHVEETIPALSRIRSQMMDDSPVLFLMNAAFESGFLNIISRDPAYVEVWRGILNLSEQITRQNNLQDPRLLLEKLLAYKASSAMKQVKVSVGISDANIKVMTAHGSKGLEFDYVFIPYATEESWSSRARNSYFILPIETLSKEDDDICDVRRLFYVALTRAREHAAIVVPLEDAGGELLTPLRFIAELDPTAISKETISKQKGDMALPQVHAEAKNTKIEEFAKEVLLEKGLSVTALNNYLKCPSLFLYKSILKVPQSPSPSAEKGITMHSAFDKIWKSVDKSPDAITALLEKTIKEEVDRSFLYLHQKQAVKKELLENVPSIVKSLTNHFHISGQAYSEHWAKTTFKGMYDGAVLEIPIHGKLDAVVDNGQTIFVFDYKTRAKMSHNQIKGETKSSDGNYFRQLVFYKLLLEAQPSSKGKEILPALVFLTPDDKGVCHSESLPIASEDIEKVKEDIQSVIDCVWSGKLLSSMCEDQKCEHCNLKKLLL